MDASNDDLTYDIAVSIGAELMQEDNDWSHLECQDEVIQEMAKTMSAEAESKKIEMKINPNKTSTTATMDSKMSKKSAPMFAGKNIAKCCVNCGEEFNRIGQQVYVSGSCGKKTFCSLDCLHQYARDDLRPELDKFEATLVREREEKAGRISFLKFMASMKGNPNVSFKTFNSTRPNGKADTDDAGEQEMFMTKKHQIIGTQLLMVKNLKTRNASAYRIFKGKFQEQYEEYIAITKNSEQRRDEGEASMQWLRAMEIFEQHFI